MPAVPMTTVSTTMFREKLFSKAEHEAQAVMKRSREDFCARSASDDEHEIVT